MKRAKLNRCVMFEVFCAECGEQLNIASGFLNKIEFEHEWNATPETLICENCGAQNAKPNSPFQSKAKRQPDAADLVAQRVYSAPVAKRVIEDW